MDEALVRVACDVSGRGFLVFEGFDVPDVNIGSFQADTVGDFWQGFVQEARLTMHIDVIRGRSLHHIAEAVFKAAARALRDAVEIDMRSSDVIPSTKGVLIA
jgi:imidazoleglycerol-phosphate dehydratase